MSTLNRSQLSSSFNTNLPDNTSGLITPAVLRGELVNIIDSTLFPQDSGSITASYATSGDGIFSGSFSGSFEGDGSSLTGVTAVTAPGGGNTDIQFNDNGVTSGSVNFTFNKNTNVVLLNGNLEVTGGITGSLFGTSSWAENVTSASYALTSTSASYASTSTSASYAVTSSHVTSYSIPAASWEWNTNYFNLTNGADNILPWDTEAFNTNSNIFELSGSGTTNARIHIKESGYYEIIGQIHFYDLFGNVDVTVKIMSGSATGPMGLVTLLNDSRFSELTADQLINGTTIINVSTPQYYSIAVNPSANTPFPSATDNTPPKIFIKKIG